MADGRQWMAWYPGDYLRDTQRLTTEQHGAYTLLLWTYWAEQGPLPDDDEELAMITRLSPERWAQQRGKLERFFEIGDGVWRQKRVEKEIDKAREAVAKARENGRRGGRPKNPDPNPPVKGSVNPSDKGPVKGRDKGLGKGSGKGSGTQNESLPQPQPQPLPSPSSPSEDLSDCSDEQSSSAERRRDSDDEGLGEQFETLWRAYSPLVRKSRREKKEACRAEWTKARKVHDPPDIHRGCIAYAESEGEYAKALVRTLRDGNYEAFIDPDEPDLPRPADGAVATDPHRLAGRAGWARALEATQVVGPADNGTGGDAAHGASSLRALPDARGTEGGGRVD